MDMDTSDDIDFITQFHSIEGDLISERQRNFCKLLKNHSVNLNEEVLNNLQPKTYLESLFLIDIFIYLKQTARLLEILKGGNTTFISKIIKQRWFFKEAFNNISIEELVNKFLPCMCFSARIKILKNLAHALDENRVDELLYHVYKRYGFCLAKKIVHCCSSNTVKEFLAVHELILLPSQVKKIFVKDPELFEVYLEHYKNKTGSTYNHKGVFKYIVEKDPKYCLDLLNNKQITRHNVGRRTSKKIIDCVKSDVISNIEDYSLFLRKDVIVRKLHGNFADVYFQLFPRKLTGLRMNHFCNVLLRYYPKKRQWDLLSQTFSKVYDIGSILDNLLVLDVPFVEIFPEKNIMHKWAEEQCKSEIINTYLKYYDCNKGIPLIKERINLTSKVFERTELVMLLLENCSQNDNLVLLEEILKYICQRHRNEESYFRNELLSKIKSLFSFTKLNENHWKYINEQIGIVRIRHEFNYFEHSIFVKKYLEYLLLNNKPFSNELGQYIEDSSYVNTSFGFDLKNPKIERELLIQIVLIIKDQLFEKQNVYLVTDIIHFNRQNPDYFINLVDLPRMCTYIKSVFDKPTREYLEKDMVTQVLLYNTEYPQKNIPIDNVKILKTFVNDKKESWLCPVIEKMVKKRNRSELENEVFKFFWENLFGVNLFLSSNIISWYFSNEPRTLLPYYDKIVENMINYLNLKALSRIKLMSHLNLDTKLIEFCVNELNRVDPLVKRILAIDLLVKSDVKLELIWHQDDYYRNLKIIKVLPLLMSTDDFINIVATIFLPVKIKLDLEDEEMRDIYLLQCEVAKSMKSLSEPVKVLPTVLKFCVGDYLQSALPSLYSCFYNSPEQELYSYMDILSQKAVSVRKHALFLSCELLNINYVMNILKTLKDDNISSQKHIFSATLKYFFKNPSEDLLNLVIFNLDTIDKNDEETLRSLIVGITNIPDKYKASYIESCWKYFETFGEDQSNCIKSNLNSILDYVRNSPHIMRLLSSDFCKYVITHYFKNTKCNLCCINDFVCQFLKNKTTEQTANFQFVFLILRPFKQSRPDAKSFFRLFYKYASKDIIRGEPIDENNYYIDLFAQNWVNLYDPILMFDEHVLLKILYLECTAVDPFVEHYAQNVVKLLEQLVYEYGPHIYSKFKSLLNERLNFDEKDLYLFFYHVIKFKATRATPLNSLLVLDLMREYSGDDEEIDRIYKNILELVKNTDDPVVRIHYNSLYSL